MSVILSGGDVHHAPRQRTLAAPRQGTLAATQQELTTAFGSPDDAQGADPTIARWHVRTPAGPATLEGLVPAENPAAASVPTELTWTISSPTAGVLPWIAHAVLGSTERFPENVLSTGDPAWQLRMTSAYADYLHLRMRDAEDARTDPTTVEWSQLGRLRVQLQALRNDVRDLVVPYHWAAASEHDRVNWMAVSQPSRDGYATELDYWHDLNRWLFADTTKLHSCLDSGAATLTAALTSAAGRAAELGTVLAGAHLTSYDSCLLGQHERTLRALARLVPEPGETEI
jgi:hypothetical protein